MFGGLFDAKPQQQQQPAQQQQQPPNSGSQTIDQAAQQQQQNGGKNAATVPGENVATQQGGTQNNQPASPSLDDFKDMWQDPANPNGQANQGKPEGYLGIDPAKIVEAVGKKDFSKVFDPALMQKALGGDQQALGGLLSKAVQTALSSALSSVHTIVERGFDTHNKRVMDSLPGEYKKFSTRDASLTENPMFQHEAVAPVFTMIQEQFATKYPNATSAEIRTMTNNYMKEMAKGMGAKFEDKQSGTESPEERLRAAAKATNETDWAKELGIEV